MKRNWTPILARAVLGLSRQALHALNLVPMGGGATSAILSAAIAVVCVDWRCGSASQATPDDHTVNYRYGARFSGRGGEPRLPNRSDRTRRQNDDLWADRHPAE